MRSVSESLAGRIGLLELSPLSADELAEVPNKSDRWFWGSYLPALGVRLPPQRLRLLWTMLTHVHGNLLNVSDLARSLSVSHQTVADSLDVFEAAYMIRRLPPFHANVWKRLTKSPKVYLRDSGLLHFLAGLRDPRE